MGREDQMVIDEIVTGQRWWVTQEVMDAVRFMREEWRSREAAVSGSSVLREGLSKAKLRLAELADENGILKSQLAAQAGTIDTGKANFDVVRKALSEADADNRRLQGLLNDAVREKCVFAAQAEQQGKRAALAEKELAEFKNSIRHYEQALVNLKVASENYLGPILHG